MARCSPFPADRASPRHGPPSRLAARKLQVQLGANLEGRVEGFGRLRKSEVARNCGPPEMNCTS